MNRTNKIKLYRIIASVIIFVLSFIFGDNAAIKLILCIVAYLIAAYDVLLYAGANIINGQIFDEKFLMSIASIGAFAVGESHEAVFVMIFFQIGELFENIAVGKSRRSVAELMEIYPEYANVMRSGNLVQVSPEEVNPGDEIVVKPGERIPLDGVITEGISSLNRSALTGESLPVDVGQGDEVISGCINLKGLLYVRVTKALTDSTVTRILALVEDAAAGKSKSENFITHFARWYTPFVVFSAVALAVIPPLFLGNWGEWIHRALVFLVISCPCALVISVPLSYFGGIGRASRLGILVKGSNYLDTLANCDTFVFDKTGTLTKGEFSVIKVISEECSKDELIALAAYAEAFSDHPIAESIKKYYGKAIDNSKISSFEESTGYGVSAVYSGKELLAGSEKLMSEKNIEYVCIDEPGTAVYLSYDGKFLGSILISDTLKSDTAESLSQLRKSGAKRIVMLTGDSKSAADAVSSKLCIDRCFSQLLPDGKLSILKNLIGNDSGKTAYVGDGINDAPCIAAADVGIAMGALGSDAAIEAADIVLMDDKLSKLPIALSIARKTKRIVKQNIAFALYIKFLVLILGALGFAGMWSAVFADVGVCVLAILNAMRTQK